MPTINCYIAPKGYNMTTQHTPGPWDASRCATPPGHTQYTIYAGDTRVAMAFETDANAHLVAAAPDLLAALESTTRCLAWHMNKHGTAGMDVLILTNARAALAKAKGLA